MGKHVATGLWCAAAGIAIVIALAVLLWPLTWLQAALLTSLALLLFAVSNAVAQAGIERTRPRLSDSELAELTDAERLEHHARGLADHERRLELRELRLARQMRAQQLGNQDFEDLLEPNPSDDELANLAQTDRQLMALVEAESQLAFERILDNRYAADQGVDTELILADVRVFVEKVARLYRPETANPLLETEIELIAKSLSSTSLHMLMVVDSLPLNLKSYNTASMYRLLRRGASYYGTYKALRPYLEQGLNVLQLARLAMGMNPITVGAAWVAGKITSHGAKAIGERMLQRQALQLLNDFIRVIGFEAAMVYGGDFRHRDANWLFGAELVNLEICRGEDRRGRDVALKTLCRLALRHEFDRVQLLSHLGRHKKIDSAGAKPLVITTQQERENIVERLARHCRDTGVDIDTEAIARWRESVESLLLTDLDIPRPAQSPSAPRLTSGRKLTERVARRVRKWTKRGRN